MGTVSGRPELMKQYSHATSTADQDLLGYVNGTLNPAIVDYDAMLPSDDRLNTDRVRSLIHSVKGLPQALSQALTTDQSVYTAAQAFEFAGSADPGQLVHETAPVYRMDEKILDDLKNEDKDGYALPPDELAKIQNIARSSNDATLRDQANRTLLNIQYKSLTDQLQAAGNDPGLRYPPGSPEQIAAVARITAIKNQLDELDGIKQALTEGGNGALPHYLLQYDTNGPRGHAVISSGDPYAAATRNIITQVFGMGTHVSGMGGDVARSDKVLQQAAGQDPTHQTAVITWYGYTAPRKALNDQNIFDSHSDVMFTAEGKQGAKALSEFQGDIAALHQGAPAHMTIIAHSYGGVVTGYAAQEPGGLHAQDVVYIGSVGTPPAGLKAMQDAGVHVYSARYHDDIAGDLADFNQKFGPLALGVPVGETVLGWLGHKDDLTGQLADPNQDPHVTQLATGDVPTIIPGVSDPVGAHSNYWSDSTVLDSFAKIATGTDLPNFKPAQDGPYESELRTIKPPTKVAPDFQ
jgi:hypothetical protein